MNAAFFLSLIDAKVMNLLSDHFWFPEGRINNPKLLISQDDDGGQGRVALQFIDFMFGDVFALFLSGFRDDILVADSDGVKIDGSWMR